MPDNPPDHQPAGQQTWHHQAWLDPPPLPALPPPPAGTAVRPYRRRVLVHGPDGWFHGLVLALARLPSGGWACLLIWPARHRSPGGAIRVLCRWAWCRVEPGRIVSGRDRPPHPAGDMTYLTMPGLDAAEADAQAALATLTLTEP